MNKVFYLTIKYFVKPQRLFSDTKNYGNDKHKIRPLFFYYCYNSKTICMILLILLPHIRYEILHFTLFFIFIFLISSVSYSPCLTWYVSSVTPLSPTTIQWRTESTWTRVILDKDHKCYILWEFFFKFLYRLQRLTFQKKY